MDENQKTIILDSNNFFVR